LTTNVTSADAFADTSAFTDGAWDILNYCGASGSISSRTSCAAAVEDYLVSEGCCAATIEEARRQWRTDVLSHLRLGRHFRVAWGGGQLQVLHNQSVLPPASLILPTKKT
jgi:hypothetical protein